MGLTISKAFGIIIFVESTEATNGGRMAELLEAIGHNIRRLRDEKGWNQTELGFRAGASPSIISLIENGKRNPSTATLAKIAEALGVEVVDLFPKGRRSSREPSLLNGLEDEQLSRFAEVIDGAAKRWSEAMASTDVNDHKRFGLIDAALDLADLISGTVRGEDDWESLTYQEQREIVGTMEKLGEVADQGISHLRESEETRAQEEQVNQRREQMRESTRRISA
jgi:transcriptional regulator with XRE-family HTH domain